MRSGFALIARNIYGYSGTELPPRLERSERFSYIAKEGEPFEYFKGRMEQLCSQLNGVAHSIPARNYSLQDYWSCTIHQLTDNPVPEAYFDVEGEPYQSYKR